jgi:hypothetical protein
MLLLSEPWCPIYWGVLFTWMRILTPRHCLTKTPRLGSTLEKRLQIDAAALQESHVNCELRSLYWISSSKNCADALTKELCQADSALMTMTQTNRLQVSPTGWVHRTDKPNTQSLMTPTRAKKKLRVSNS